MSSSVALENAKMFRPRGLQNRLKVEQTKSIDPIGIDRLAVGDRSVQGTWQYSDLTSGGAWGSIVTFLIPRSIGMIWDMYLEVTMPSDTVTYAPLPAVNIINQYEVILGNTLIKCSGEAMFEARRAFAGQELRTRMINAAGGSGGTGLANTSLQIPLDYPGALRVSRPGLVFSVDNAFGEPFPLNKCFADMQIKITLPTAASMVSTGSAPAGNPTLRVWYYSVASSNPQDMDPIVREPIIIPGYYVNEAVSYQPQTLSSTTTIPVDLTPSLLDAELSVILAKCKLATDVASNNRFNSSQIVELHERVNGQDFYKHYNANDGAYKMLLFTNENAFDFIAAGTGTACNLYTYILPQNVSPATDLYGSEFSGLNLYRQAAYLDIKATASGAGNVFAATVNKCYWIIDTQGSINYYYVNNNY